MPPIHQDYADFKFFFQTSQLELRESKPQYVNVRAFSCNCLFRFSLSPSPFHSVFLSLSFPSFTLRCLPLLLSLVARNRSFHEVNCLVSLVVVTACCVVATPISGDFLNPAFALGVAWVTRSWTWVPFAAPFIASVLGAIVSRLCDAQMNWIAEVFGAAYNSELQAYQQTQKSLAKKGNARSCACALSDNVELAIIMDQAQKMSQRKEIHIANCSTFSRFACVPFLTS